MSTLAAGLLFVCTPVAVWDGDGPIWCAEGPRLRIACIAARELDNTCRPHYPCPKASGIDARNALIQILGGPRGLVHLGPRGEPSAHVRVAGPRLACRSTGTAKGNRTAAICRLPTGQDLACAQLATRTVVIWRSFSGKRRC